ncbi:MAG TPA: HAMP domain-containing sensor histidine kinase [Candidatus Acidoferrum sp.]|nr:HAMP domain-containing sensor histidine kinase [Candidatus Acidoferrum sp.]
MTGSSRRFLAAVLFTALLIVLVNLAWWIYYRRTEALLETQLSRRLSSVVQTASAGLSRTLVDSLLAGDIDAYARVSLFLEKARAADSLSELFIIDENYFYLATTLVEPESTYFLARLNGRYIDSLFYGASTRCTVTPTYETGDLYLKSAFAPLLSASGVVVGVLGADANVDYSDALNDLKRNLAYSTAISLAGGLALGLLFLLLQRRLNRAEQQLFIGQTHTYLGRMVAVVAHEVRNPLMIIRASAERLGKKINAEETGFIVEEIDRLNGIVTGYLDFARADGPFLSGQQPEDFELGDFLAGVRKNLTEKYGGTEVQWLDDGESRPLSFRGYRRSLRQVMLNLLMNGVEACQAARKPIVLGLSANDHGHRTEIIVSDRGPGLSHKEIKRLFTPFYTTKQAGSGLGLYLSQKIVAEMGGTVKIESRLGHGTSIIISLPKVPRK